VNPKAPPSADGHRALDPDPAGAVVDRALAELLADRIAEHLMPMLRGSGPTNSRELIDAAEVARILGCERSWVCQHKSELPLVRLGSGSRPRLRWFEANRAGWAERTVADYGWALTHHLLPYFASYRLKLSEGRLGGSQINKTLKRLSQILELAEEYEYIPRNLARGKRRRVKAPKVQRSWVSPSRRSRWSRPARGTCGR
jgi:hypothetical protein